LKYSGFFCVLIGRRNNPKDQLIQERTDDMKTTIRISAAVLLVLMLCAAFAGCKKAYEKPEPQVAIPDLPQSGSGVRLKELTFVNSVWMDFQKPRCVKVLHAEPVEADIAFVRELAEKAGMTEDTVTKVVENDDTITFTNDKGASMIVFKASGSISISLPGEETAAANEPAVSMAEIEYINAARAWLENAGLLSEDYLEKEPRVGDNEIVAKLVEGKYVSYPTLKTVTFMFRDYGGIEVGGVAPRISVDLTLEGKVVSVSKIQRSFSDYLSFSDTASPEEAAERLENGEGVFYVSGEVGESGIINKIELKYYNRDVMDDTPYVVPVYVFSGTSGEGEFTAVVTALLSENYVLEQPAGTAPAEG
jgi:hypothetical protein